MTMSIELRKIRCIDGLHYSFEMAKYFHENLYGDCCAINEDNSRAIQAIAGSWGFIDALHRIREIAQSTPGINVKHQEMRAFLRSTELAEEFRHYIQHLRGELANDPLNTFPVWGAISWVDPNKPNRCHTAMLGAQIQGTQFSSCVYDRLNNNWVSKVALTVNDKSFNFDPIYMAVERLRKYLIPAIIKGSSSEIEFHEKLPIISVDFELPENA
jgi:hypothetical protein